ncbi:MAG: class I SAM-dependent methyltransferase [Thermodesulfobacteriota bacterium]
MRSRNGLKSEEIPGDYQYQALYHGPISQKLWHYKKYDVLNNVLKSGCHYKMICDAGCGSGTITNLVAKSCPESQVFGFDINQSSITFAQRQFAFQSNATFKCQDLLQANKFAEMDFDLIYSLEVIEHFHDEDVIKFLSSLYRMGHKTSQYFLTTPDYRSLWPLIELLIDRLALAPPLNLQHLTRFTKKKLISLLTSRGFRIVEIFNFCGFSPFFGHISPRLAHLVDTWEQRIGYGNIIGCHFEKSSI